MNDSFSVYLKVAEFASFTLAGVGQAQQYFPELRGTTNSVLLLLNDAFTAAVRSYPPINGHAAEILGHVKPIELVTATKVEEDCWEPDSGRDANRCKALLLEVLRRAAYDWVLYRQHSKMALRELAEDAYIWLFEEDEDHLYWKQRKAAMVEVSTGGVVEGARVLTSLMSICECLDLDIETVRARLRKMDIRSIIAAGRPAETRKVPTDASAVEECGITIPVDMDAMPDGEYTSQYESYGTTSTPSRLRQSDYPYSG